MRVEGEAAGLAKLLFPEGLVPQILRLIVDAWTGFRRPSQDEGEPKITHRFVRAMQTRKQEQGLQFRVVPHEKELEHLDEQTGQGYAEIDILVPHGYDERCYFGIEAKKLNTTTEVGKWESQAGDYVGRDGMGCFIEGRYAPHQNQGGMLGYVMDGDCKRAKASISEAMTKRTAELRLPATFELHASRHLPDLATAFETRHGLDRGGFLLHHILVAAA
jgi:hypothetical protein